MGGDLRHVIKVSFFARDLDHAFGFSVSSERFSAIKVPPLKGDLDQKLKKNLRIQKKVVPLPSQKWKWRDLDCLQPLKKMLNYISYQCFVFLASAF
jgi:hypothetical protein